MPPPIEERVAYLEGKVEDHSRGFGQIRDQITNVDGHVLFLDQKVDRFREELASRIDSLNQKVDRIRTELVSRIDALDQKVDRFREELISRIDAVDRKASRQFVWLVGIQVAILLSVIGSLLQG